MARQYPRVKLRLGGHSKGGNLAVWAGVFCPLAVQRRIRSVWSNDGPGFHDDILSLPRHVRLAERIHTIVPKSSVVGMLLEHEEDYTVVDSSQQGLMQHDGFSWAVKGPGFVRLHSVTRQARLCDQELRGWVQELTEEQREQFIDSAFQVLEASGAQTLTDLMTIHKEKGHVDNLTVGFCGDLKFGRTVHSLVAAMSRYTGIRFVFISPEELKLPRYVKEQYIKSKNIPYTQSTSLEEVMPELDILYMTRVQKERFFNEEDYLRLKDSYILTPEKLRNAKKDLCILHPLPRVNEISVAVDDDPRACYFKQVRNGRFIRMALILKLLGIE